MYSYLGRGNISWLSSLKLDEVHASLSCHSCVELGVYSGSFQLSAEPVSGCARLHLWVYIREDTQFDDPNSHSFSLEFLCVLEGTKSHEPEVSPSDYWHGDAMPVRTVLTVVCLRR